MKSKFPQSSPLKHISIRKAKDATEFAIRLDPYLIEALKKGIPSLFNSIQDMYLVDWQVATIENLLLQYKTNLTNHASFSEKKGKEEPTVLLWTFYVLAQHFSAKRDTKNALIYIDTAIQHTPTLVELYMQKARILKVH